jgi:hypothetical protein
MKKPNSIIKEYVSHLSDVEVSELNQRLSQRLGGDYGQVATMLEQDPNIDFWLKTASSADEWFDMVDRIGVALASEEKKREMMPKNIEVAV